MIYWKRREFRDKLLDKYKKFGLYCWTCGKDMTNCPHRLEWDHIWSGHPKDNTWKNAGLICRTCNCLKRDRQISYLGLSRELLQAGKITHEQFVVIHNRLRALQRYAPYLILTSIKRLRKKYEYANNIGYKGEAAKIVNIAFPVPAPLHRRIKVAAGSKGLSMSKYLVNLMKREHPRGGKK